MKLRLLLIALVFCCFAQLSFAQEDEKVLLDNEWVRVIYAKDRPGHKRVSHSHVDTLVYTLSNQHRRITNSGEKPRDIGMRANEAVWMADVTHSEENIGTTDGERLIVEVKQKGGSWKPASPADDPAKWPDKLDAVRAAPGNHRVLLENESVRVLEVTVRPSENEPLHMHRMPSVLYVISEEDIQDFDAAGKLLYDTRTQPAPPKTPYAEWMPPQPPHRVVNRSKTALRLIRIELK